MDNKDERIRLIIEEITSTVVDNVIKEQKISANKGDVAEGILAAAITAAFLWPDRELTKDDVFRVVQQLDQNKDRSKSKTIVKAKTFKRPPAPHLDSKTNDEILLTIGLAANNFRALTDYGFFNSMAGIVNAAIKFTQSNNLKPHIQESYNNPNKNSIKVLSVGTEDQKGTKVDVKVEMDGKIIPGTNISLKTANTKQLGQVGRGWAGDPEAKRFVRGIADLFNSLFGVTVSSSLKRKYIETIQHGSKEEILDVLQDLYYDAYKKIERRFEGNENELIDFLRTFASGVRYEAVLNEKGVVLVQLGSNSFKAMNFDKLLELVEDPDLKIDIEVEYQLVSNMYPYIYIYMSVNDENYGNIVAVRPKVRFKGDRLYEFRHYVEKGSGLSKLIAIE